MQRKGALIIIEIHFSPFIHIGKNILNLQFFQQIALRLILFLSEIFRSFMGRNSSEIFHQMILQLRIKFRISFLYLSNQIPIVLCRNFFCDLPDAIRSFLCHPCQNFLFPAPDSPADVSLFRNRKDLLQLLNMVPKPHIPHVSAGVKRQIGYGIPVKFRCQADKINKTVRMLHGQERQTGLELHLVVIPLPS